MINLDSVEDLQNETLGDTRDDKIITGGASAVFTRRFNSIAKRFDVKGYGYDRAIHSSSRTPAGLDCTIDNVEWLVVTAWRRR